MKVHAVPVGTPWMWTLAFGHHEDRTPTHGYARRARGCDGWLSHGKSVTMRVPLI
jgi:hypothetical protein